MLPVTDFIPTALVVWFLVYVKNKETALTLFLENKISDKLLIRNILDNNTEV